jgi:hypothetical protein
MVPSWWTGRILKKYIVHETRTHLALATSLFRMGLTHDDRWAALKRMAFQEHPIRAEAGDKLLYVVLYLSSRRLGIVSAST